MHIDDEDENLNDLSVEDQDGELEGDAEPGEAAAETLADEEGEEGGLVISIGEDPAPEEEGKAPQWVKDIREENRRLKREKAERERAEQERQNLEVGEKPTLEGCDYDAERYENELLGFHQRKAKADEITTQRDQEAQVYREAWNQDFERYNSQKTSAGEDFQDMADRASDKLDVTQQAVIIQAADNAAHVIYALGKYPQRLEELAAIKNPIKLARAVVKLEQEIKVAPRRKAPANVDEPERGSASISGGGDKELERLEKIADKTGDRSALIAYKRKQRRAA
jgi:hypothetical protein